MAVSGGTFGGRFRGVIARDSQIRFKSQPPLYRDVRVASPEEAGRLARQAIARKQRDEAIAREVKRQQREIALIVGVVLVTLSVLLGIKLA